LWKGFFIELISFYFSSWNKLLPYLAIHYLWFKTANMTNSQRFKFPKTVLFGITAVYLILIVATYFLYFKEPIQVCAKRMMIAQSVALVFQIVLNYINYH